MSLTSYQAAPPRVFIMSRQMTKSNGKTPFAERILTYSHMHTSRLKRVAPCLYKYESSGVYFAHVRAEGKLHRKSLETTDRQLANRRLADFRRALSRVDSGLSRT